MSKYDHWYGGTKSYDATHQACPKCGKAKLKILPGETRTCPLCGHTWTRRT